MDGYILVFHDVDILDHCMMVCIKVSYLDNFNEDKEDGSKRELVAIICKVETYFYLDGFYSYYHHNVFDYRIDWVI